VLKKTNEIQAEWNDAGLLGRRLLEQLAHHRGANATSTTEWHRDLRRLAQVTGRTEEAILTMLGEDLDRFED